MTNDKPIRLAKCIADAGLCSRREAERWIEAGCVKVNGSWVKTPAFTVTEQDVVEVDGQALPQPEQTRLFLFHKPTGVLCTASDPEGRPTIYDVLPATLPRVVPVGRLDINSEGLLLLTNNGALAQNLMRGDWPRLYRVRVHGKLMERDLARLRKGITHEKIRYQGIEIEQENTSSKGTNNWYKLALIEGKNREIRNLMAACGVNVTRLIRVAYGPFSLGTLEAGAVQEVPAKTLNKLID